LALHDKKILIRFAPTLLCLSDVPNDHQIAIEGWKSRKDQLHKQQKSVTEVNDEAEKVNLLSLSKQKSSLK
jgi:hypothetical protein